MGGKPSSEASPPAPSSPSPVPMVHEGVTTGQPMEEQDEGKFDPTSFQFDKADEEKFDPTSFRFDKAILTETQEKWKDANKRPEVMAEEAIFEMNRNLSLGVVTGMFYGVWLAKRKVTQKAVDAHVDKYKFDVALAAESKKNTLVFHLYRGLTRPPKTQECIKSLRLNHWEL